MSSPDFVNLLKGNEIERLLCWSKNMEAPPFSMELKITDRCNLNCRSCIRFVQAVKEHQELPTGEYLSLIQEAADLGVRRIILVGPGGGEVMMRRELCLTIMRETKIRGMEGILTTNGTLFQKDDIKKLVEVGWDGINISLDGPTAEINDYLRNAPGAFKRIINNVLLFKEYKGKHKLYIHPKISFSPVLSNRNYLAVDQFFDLAKKCGVDIIHFQPMSVFSEPTRELELTLNQRREFRDLIMSNLERWDKLGITHNLRQFLEFDNLLDKTTSMDEVYRGFNPKGEGMQFPPLFNAPLLRSLPLKSFFSMQFPPLFNAPCLEPWRYIGVTVDGYVMPCCSTTGDTNATSHMKSNDVRYRLGTLKDIWLHSELFNNMRTHLKKQELLPVCRNCCPARFLDTQELKLQLRMKFST